VAKTTDTDKETMIINTSQWPKDQVRIVFDGDGVLFSDEAECVYRTKGLAAFREFEHENQHIALPEGPMHAFALKLQKLREALGKDNKWRVRTFLVTARNGVANERAFQTLEQWGLEIDETHFLGGLNKTPFLLAIDPAIFFDDSSEHIKRAQQYVPAAHILYGIGNVISDDTITELPTTPVVSNEEIKNIEP
jgi:5'-nucleotidase